MEKLDWNPDLGLATKGPNLHMRRPSVRENLYSKTSTFSQLSQNLISGHFLAGLISQTSSQPKKRDWLISDLSTITADISHVGRTRCYLIGVHYPYILMIAYVYIWVESDLIINAH